MLLAQTPALARLVHVRALRLDDWALAAAASFLAVLAPLGRRFAQPPYPPRSDTRKAFASDGD